MCAALSEWPSFLFAHDLLEPVGHTWRSSSFICDLSACRYISHIDSESDEAKTPPTRNESVIKRSFYFNNKPHGENN